MRQLNDSNVYELVELRMPGRHFTGPIHRSFRIVTSFTDFESLPGFWLAPNFPPCPTSCGNEARNYSRLVQCVDRQGNVLSGGICDARSTAPATTLSCAATMPCGMVQFIAIKPTVEGTHMRNMKEIEVFRRGVVPDAPLGQKSSNAMNFEAGVWEYEAGGNRYQWSLVPGSLSSFRSPLRARGHSSWGSPALLLDGEVGASVRFAWADMDRDGTTECELTLDFEEPTPIDLVRFAGVYSDLEITLWNADSFGNPTVAAGECFAANSGGNSETNCYQPPANTTTEVAAETAPAEDWLSHSSESANEDAELVPPCSNRGTCTAARACACDAGYAGNTCESSTDECGEKYAGRCNFVSLVNNMTAYLALDPDSNFSSLIRTELRQSYCACKSVVRRAAHSLRNVTVVGNCSSERRDGL
eukprot:SAG31_NODE_4770_length_2967_cov_1.571478_2_plen_416_part_00